MSSKNLDDAIALAKLAEIAERYDGMCSSPIAVPPLI